MSECLTSAEIEGLLADTLPPADKARAKAHLAECETCRQEVARLRADEELFGKIKQAYGAETVSRPDDPGDSSGPSGPPTESIEGYEILSEVHRGGQGVVYKAVQRATKRTVALKVLLEGPYASPRQRHRFEREIDLVASLQHPNIVTVYDSGVTRDGRHFFAMEYIHGQPLDAYLSNKSLSIDETLRLFQRICAAVNHAHQHGVIHRDLKPGNIRVDATGEPHVLDFGLAKAGAGGLTPDGAPVTVTGEFMGTLAYASPEQTKGDPTLIDIRTDVYSLGVILYEMLTGKYPYQVVGQMADVLKNIAEAEPKRPSTIRRQINDEVETIVLKSLAKEKERRYQSADTLGRDIEHYLSGQPIDAKRDSSWYVIRKSLRRYRVPVAVAAAFVLVLGASTVALSIMFQHQNRARQEAEAAWAAEETQRKVAEAARNDADQARGAEEKQRKSAEAERDRAIEAEQEAERQRDLVSVEKREARRQAYVANIAAAQAALSMNEAANVYRHLDAAPPEFRNWEWEYLHSQADYYAKGDHCLAILQGHEGPVYSLAFSPDGGRVASASTDKTARIWHAFTGEELAILSGHEAMVGSVVFSPDGTQLASTSHDGTARLWDSVTGEELAVLLGHEDWVSSVAFSPDGTRLASVSRDATLRLWDARSGQQLSVIQVDETARFLAFSPNGARLVSSGSETVVLLDTSADEGLAIVQEYDCEGCRMGFSPDSAHLMLASASLDAALRIADAATGEEFALREEFALLEAALGEELARAIPRTFEEFALLEAAPSEELARAIPSWTLLVQAFAPDGTHFAWAFLDGTIGVWDKVSGQELAILSGHESPVRSVAFSPDGTRLASGGKDETVRVWDASTGEELALLRGHQSAVTSVEFSPDGTRLVSASSFDPTVRLWGILGAHQLALLQREEGAVGSVAFSPDSTRVASGEEDGTVRVWDTSTGELLAILRAHAASVGPVEFSSDGTRLASGAEDNTVRIWDAVSGEELALFRGHCSAIRSVAFSPDATRLASASADRTVRLWDPSTGEGLAVLRGHESSVRSVAFSPDGTRLASGSWDETVRVWDGSTGEELDVMRAHTGFVNSGHKGRVYSVAFSVDGTRLASGSDDGTLRVWDASTGEQLLVLRGHQDSVCAVAFGPDGKRLASASADETTRIWHAVPYHVRYQQRQAILAARPEAEQIIGALWEESNDWKSVAQQLRADDSLTDPVRRAALNSVLRRAAGPGRANPPTTQPASQHATRPAEVQESSTP